MTVSIDSLLRSIPRDLGRSPIRKSDILKVWKKQPTLSSQRDVNTGLALFGECGVKRLCQQNCSHREGDQNGNDDTDPDPQCLASSHTFRLCPDQTKEVRQFRGIVYFLDAVLDKTEKFRDKVDKQIVCR